jgi:uncharacterized glyoxalase superfamily protein PhnB
VAELVGASSRIYLLAKPEGTRASRAAGARRSYARHWTPVHLDFVVEDIDAAVRRAQAAGASLEADTQSQEWGRCVSFADPFGHGFCLLEFSGRGYDEVAD